MGRASRRKQERVAEPVPGPASPRRSPLSLPDPAKLRAGYRFATARGGDPDFVVHTIQIPYAGHPLTSFEGPRAAQRLIRFCAKYLEGSGLLPRGLARQISLSAEEQLTDAARIDALLHLVAERARTEGWDTTRLVHDLGLHLQAAAADPAPEPAPTPSEGCPGCELARAYGKAEGLPPEMSEMLVSVAHQIHGARGAAAPLPPPPLPLDVLPALALAKGLAVTMHGPWRIVMQHLEGHYQLSLQAEAPQTTEADWYQAALIVRQLGAPREPLVPVEQLPPDHAITWRWPAPAAPGGLATDVRDAN